MCPCSGLISYFVNKDKVLIQGCEWGIASAISVIISLLFSKATELQIMDCRICYSRSVQSEHIEPYLDGYW